MMRFRWPAASVRPPVIGFLALGLALACAGRVWAETEILEPSDAPVVPAAPLIIESPADSAASAKSHDTVNSAAVIAPAVDTTVVTPADTKTDTVATSAPASPAPLAPNEIAADSTAITIEIDRSLGRNADKSLGLALLGSAILPGTGEWYLRSGEKGRGFLLAEVGFWAALFMSLSAQDTYLQSARNQASEYAGIDASRKGEGFLNTMAEYRSYREKEHRNDSYELAQILSGKRNGDYDIPPTPENDWDFGSSNTPQNTRNWKTFQSTLRYYRASKVVTTFAIGGLALNRLIAMAHTLHLYRRTAVQGLSENRVQSGFENRFTVLSEIGPGYAGGRLALSF